MSGSERAYPDLPTTVSGRFSVTGAPSADSREGPNPFWSFSQIVMTPAQRWIPRLTARSGNRPIRLHMAEVTGSIPVAPTQEFLEMGGFFNVGGSLETLPTRMAFPVVSREVSSFRALPPRPTATEPTRNRELTFDYGRNREYLPPDRVKFEATQHACVCNIGRTADSADPRLLRRVARLKVARLFPRRERVGQQRRTTLASTTTVRDWQPSNRQIGAGAPPPWVMTTPSVFSGWLRRRR
jgi:hypothetical protein